MSSYTVELAGVHDRHVEARPAIAWYRNAEWIAWRTGSFPRNEKLRFDTPPRHPDAGAAPLDLAGRLDERLGVVAVLLEPGRDREDVRIDDDVARVGTRPRRSSRPIGSIGDLDLSLDRAGLSLLVEAHHDDRRAVAAAPREPCSRKSSSPSLRLIEFTTPLPWTHLRPASITVPVRGVDHDRNARDLGLGRDAGSGTSSSPARRRAGRRPCSRRACSRRCAPARARRRPPAW